ncbi:MAG: TIM44-like domain-containing protein [Rubrivivax sp.]|nr:TIM44-like domain-containing protein [Rubrivivax sp.]
MKSRWFVGLLSAVLVVGMSPDLSEAKRLGGGKSTGMQRQAPAQTPPQMPPAQAPAAAAPAAPVAVKPATPAAATAAAAAPAKRSWMGPLAGLAVGLGLAALFSAMGMGEGFANFVMLLLLGIVAFFLIRFLISRFMGNKGAAQPALATAGAGAGTGATGGSPWQAPAAEQPLARTSSEGAASAGEQAVSVTGTPLRPINIGENLGTPAAIGATAPLPAAMTLPEGFDLPAFERVAKMIFIRMQAAHDTADLDDLREFTTPEMFAAVRLEIQERGGVTQHTDVERVDAQLIDFVQEASRHIASVRFQGLVREEKDAPASAFDEVWHLVKPQDGSRSWAIAGIQQPQ